MSNDEELCNVEPHGNDFICNLNNISYYIGKVALEKNESSTPYFKETDVKTNEGHPVFSLEYSGESAEGYIGLIRKEMTKMTTAIGNISDALNANPTFKCIDCNSDNNPKFIYESQWKD